MITETAEAIAMVFLLVLFLFALYSTKHLDEANGEGGAEPWDGE